jgi:hypothetical protein
MGLTPALEAPPLMDLPPSNGGAAPKVRRLPRLLVAFLVAIVLGSGTVVLVSVLRDPVPETTSAPAEAAVAYLDAVEPLAKKGGEVVALGLRAGINDIRDRRYPASVLENMSWAWLRDLRTTARSWRAIDPPVELESAHAMLVRALDGYVETAALVHAAARARGAERAVFLEEAILRGEAADDLWDRAIGLSHEHLEEVNVPARPWFGVHRP